MSDHSHEHDQSSSWGDFFGALGKTLLASVAVAVATAVASHLTQSALGSASNTNGSFDDDDD